MENGILVDFGRIFRILLKKWWLFIVVFSLTVVLASCLTKESNSYTAEGKVLVYQRSGEEIGNVMDNASRLQVTYDTVQMLKSGKFLERVQSELSFEVKVSELKECVTTEQLPPSRTIVVKVVRGQEDEAQEILCAIQKNAVDFIQQMLPDVKMQVLENENTIQVNEKSESGLENGIKIGILAGMALCVLVAFVLVALYLLNDSIRYKEDVGRYLELPVIAEFPEGGAK